MKDRPSPRPSIKHSLNVNVNVNVNAHSLGSPAAHHRRLGPVLYSLRMTGTLEAGIMPTSVAIIVMYFSWIAS